MILTREEFRKEGPRDPVSLGNLTFRTPILVFNTSPLLNNITLTGEGGVGTKDVTSGLILYHLGHLVVGLEGLQ